MQTIQSVGIIILTAFGVWIAWRQFVTARTKLQLDLFDRRYVVFAAARAFLADICAHAASSESALRAFELGTADAAFFYGDDILTYLAGLRTKAYELQGIIDTLPAHGVGDQRTNLVAAKWDRVKWMHQQFELLTATFLPYLRLTDRGRQRFTRAAAPHPTGPGGPSRTAHAGEASEGLLLP